MKRLLTLLLAAFLLPCAAFAEKYDALPPIFAISYQSQERRVGDNEIYIYKEYLQTTNRQVNDELRELTDDFDLRMSPTLRKDNDRNAKRNSRLDIETVYYRTGQSWLSAMVLARVSWKREQVCCPFATRTYDLETGKRILLTDLFPENSKAWDVLQKGVRKHLNAIFPSEKADAAKVDALCAPDALKQADFTLSGMELTLHYEARAVYPTRTGMVHVRFYYPQFKGMMTEEAAAQTDNSRWKMVALTCDDGPNYTESGKALNNLRQGGARVTYFIVGKKIPGFSDVLQREFDENHLIAGHSYHHWSGYTMKPETRLKDIQMENDLLYELTGEGVSLFRAPGGTYPPWVEAKIGLPLVEWSVDTYDYTGKNYKKIFYSVRNNAQDGDIILMHDTGLQMFKAVPLIARWLTDNGFLMVTVEELAQAQNVKLEPDVVYHRCFEGDYAPRKDSNLN